MNERGTTVLVDIPLARIVGTAVGPSTLLISTPCQTVNNIEQGTFWRCAYCRNANTEKQTYCGEGITHGCGASRPGRTSKKLALTVSTDEFISFDDVRLPEFSEALFYRDYEGWDEDIIRGGSK